jgi:hypothetical protein
VTVKELILHLFDTSCDLLYDLNGTATLCIEQSPTAKVGELSQVASVNRVSAFPKNVEIVKSHLARVTESGRKQRRSLQNHIEAL